MSLKREMELQGQWLFRWRSYLPFAFLPLLIPGVISSHHDGTHPLKDIVWPLLCWAVSISGLLIRIHCVGYAAKGTSGRNTKKQIAEALNTTGLYSVLRHPLYLGNFLIALGIIAQPLNGWVIAVFVLAFYLYYERIMLAEEVFLERQFGEEFLSWACITPAFLPNLRRWKTAEVAFDFAKVARQEAAAVGVITVGFITLETTEHWVSEGSATIEPWWIVFGCAGAMGYAGLRFYKKLYCTRRARAKMLMTEMGFHGVRVARIGMLSALLILALSESASCVENAPTTSAVPSEVNVDLSRVYIFVDKSGFGHQHGIEGRLSKGTVKLGETHNAGQLIFDMRSFDADTPAAKRYLGLTGTTSASVRSQVNANMKSTAVLSVQKYPTATFDISSSQRSTPNTGSGATKYLLIGNFTLRGTTRPISVDAEVDEVDGQMTIRGSFTIKQTDFGMTPYTKAFGAIGVADAITIHGDLRIDTAK